MSKPEPHALAWQPLLCWLAEVHQFKHNCTLMTIFKSNFVQTFSILQLFLQKATLCGRIIVLWDLHILEWFLCGFWKQLAIDQTFRLLVILRVIRFRAIVILISFCQLDGIVRCSCQMSFDASWRWTGGLLCICIFLFYHSFFVCLMTQVVQMSRWCLISLNFLMFSLASL